MDLLNMREMYLRERIMLCFNGPISRSLIEEIGNALRNYLNSHDAAPSSSMDVFAVYIEMTQNIRHYARLKGYSEDDAAATVAVARDAQGHYVVSSGNLIDLDDGQPLLDAISALEPLNKEELKKAYKQRLRQPREAEASSGAGLGLLDIARKSSQPIRASLTPLNDGHGFFSLTAVI